MRYLRDYSHSCFDAGISWRYGNHFWPFSIESQLLLGDAAQFVLSETDTTCIVLTNLAGLFTYSERFRWLIQVRNVRSQPIASQGENTVSSPSQPPALL